MSLLVAVTLWCCVKKHRLRAAAAASVKDALSRERRSHFAFPSLSPSMLCVNI